MFTPLHIDFALLNPRLIAFCRCLEVSEGWGLIMKVEVQKHKMFQGTDMQIHVILVVQPSILEGTVEYMNIARLVGDCLLIRQPTLFLFTTP